MTQLGALISELAGLAAPEDEFHFGDRYTRIECIPAPMTERTAYVPKLSTCLRAAADVMMLDDCDLVSYPLLIPHRCEEAIARLVRGECFFVGELDPLDLNIFLQLHDVLTRHGMQTPVYDGISDRWLDELDLTLAAQSKARFESSLTLRMSSFEVLHWQRISSLFPSIRGSLGPRCSKLLDEGVKLEMDAIFVAARADGAFLKRVSSAFGQSSSGA